MKIKKSAIIIISVIAVVALIVIFYIYNSVMISGEEAQIADIQLPEQTATISLNLDTVYPTNLRWKDAICIRGWLFKENAVSQGQRALYLVLRSKESNTIYKIENGNLPRPDVTKAFQLDNSANNHGFEVTFPTKELAGQTYKLGFIIVDKAGSYYAGANRMITIPEDSKTGIQIQKGPEPKAIAKRVTIPLKEPTTKMKFFFDKVDKSDEYLTVTGWAYLDGMNSVGQHTYLFLKKDKKMLVYELKSQLRKDVTKVFGKNQFNLDSAGFISSV